MDKTYIFKVIDDHITPCAINHDESEANVNWCNGEGWFDHDKDGDFRDDPDHVGDKMPMLVGWSTDPVKALRAVQINLARLQANLTTQANYTYTLLVKLDAEHPQFSPKFFEDGTEVFF